MNPGMFLIGMGVGIVTWALHYPNPTRSPWLYVITVAWDVALVLFLTRAALPLIQCRPDIWKMIPPPVFVPACMIGALR